MPDCGPCVLRHSSSQTIAVLGGLAYGYDSCGNILSCFESPAWLIIAANTCAAAGGGTAIGLPSHPRDCTTATGKAHNAANEMSGGTRACTADA